MPELTLQDISQIARDVRRQEITFSHLADELIDHLCCDVEYEMKKGLSFHEAYHAVSGRIGSRRLKEIQEETLYAVDTKYRKMKKTMKIAGIAGTVMLGFAAMSKIMHWPAAGILLTLGAMTLAFVFMPSALGVLWKETHNRKRLFLYVSAFLAGMFFIFGVMFKVQHWPFAGLVLMLASLCGVLCFLPALLAVKLRDAETKSKKAIYILGAAGMALFILGLLCKIQHWPLAMVFSMSGLAVIFLLVFPWYTRVTWKDDTHVSAKFIFMVTGSLALIMPAVLINLSLQRNYDAGYYREIDQQQALFEYISDSNRDFIAGCSDTAALPLLASLDAKTRYLLKVISSIEEKMIAASEAKPGETLAITDQIRQTENGPVIYFPALLRPFHSAPYRDFLQEGSASRTELNNALNEYSQYLSGLMPVSTFSNYEKLLDPQVYLPASDPETERISLMSGLHMLALMKNGILTTESYVLSAVSEHK